jgi:hypothetical protein
VEKTFDGGFGGQEGYTIHCSIPCKKGDWNRLKQVWLPTDNILIQISKLKNKLLQIDNKLI